MENLYSEHRSVPCPECGVQPGQFCDWDSLACHQPRVEAWIEADYQRLMHSVKAVTKEPQ